MEALLSIAIGALVAAGVFLLLRPRTFSVVLGYTLVSYAVNLFLFSSGRVRGSQPPVIVEGVSDYADPLPQALVLTAIVIGLGMTAFLIVLALRANAELASDHVDGEEGK
jgi:multicomponent K+:H+ antiporter subunit C